NHNCTNCVPLNTAGEFLNKSKLELFKDIAEFLNAETDRDTKIEGAPKMLDYHSEYATGCMFFRESEGSPELKTRSERPPSLEKEGYHHRCEGKCWCVNKYNNRELKRATNIFVCTRLEKARMAYPGENNNITHHATVPLLSGDESFGLLNVASPDTEQFAKD